MPSAFAFHTLYVKMCRVCLCLCNSVETSLYKVSILFVHPCRWFLRPVLCASFPRGEGPHYGGDARGVRQGGEVCDPEARLRKLKSVGVVKYLKKNVLM